MYKLGRLIPLESDIKGLPKTLWYHILLRRVKLIRIIELLNRQIVCSQRLWM